VGQYPAFFDLFVEIPGTGAILELTSTRLDIPNVNISEYDLIFFVFVLGLRTSPLPELAPRLEGLPLLWSWPCLTWRRAAAQVGHLPGQAQFRERPPGRAANPRRGDPRRGNPRRGARGRSGSRGGSGVSRAELA
jgi:hypothetical protein